MISFRNKIIRGTASLAAANALSRIASFVSVIFVTRALSLYEYGVVMLALAIGGPVNAITGLGMDELIVADTSRSLGEGNVGRAKKLLVQFFGFRVALLAALGIIGWAARDALTARYGEAVSSYFALTAGIVFAHFLQSSATIVLHAFQEFHALSRVTAVEPLAKLALVGAFASRGLLSIKTVLVIIACAALASIVAVAPTLMRITVRLLAVRAPRERIFLTTFRTHGKWQMALDLISNISSGIKYWFIKAVLSVEAVAVFSVAQSMFSALASLFPLKSVVFPIISSRIGDLAVMRGLVQRVTKYAFLSYSAMLIGALVLAPPFIMIFFPKYSGSIFIFSLMAFRLPLNAFSIAHAPVLVSLQEQRFLSLIAFKNIVSVLVFLPLLMMLWGLPGAVLEGYIPVLLSIMWREKLLRKKYNFSSFTLRTLWRFDREDRTVLKELYRAARARLHLSHS